jgi:hypothetical protein
MIQKRKPERFYELIETMYPGQPKLELFARAARPGWVAWGNELHRAETDSASESKRGLGASATGRTRRGDVPDGEREPESDAKSMGRMTPRENVVLSQRNDKPGGWKVRSYADGSRANKAAERERQAGRTVEHFERLELPRVDRPDLSNSS